MVDNNWVLIGVGFVIGVAYSYFVCDIIFPIKEENDY